MSDDVFDKPQERLVFLQALRAFSEACEAPELTASCPFAVDVRPGLRGCGEECMDILGRHRAPVPVDEHVLESGVTVSLARRPRARRSREPRLVAFDAKQIYLEDQSGGPPPRWRLTSILQAIEERVAEVPPSDEERARERLVEIRRLCDLAEGRGLEFETHLAPSIRRRVAAAVFAYSVARRDREAVENEAQLLSWSQFLSQTVGFDFSTLDQAGLGTRFGEAMREIARWAVTASIDDLLAWRPHASARPQPQTDPPNVAEDDDGARKVAEDDGEWIFDRFTRTYLERWSTESLRREWLYLHGQHGSPCSSIEMRVRDVGEGELALVMADRLVAEGRRRASGAPRRDFAGPVTSYLVDPAVRFLAEGRRLEARALFEAILHQEPDSSDAHNNLGFCMLPDDPESALEHFEIAVGDRHVQIELVTVNRMLALAKLSRRTTMLDAALNILSPEDLSSDEPVELQLGPTGTWLWKVDSVLGEGPPELVQTADFRAYAMQIVRFVAVGA